MSALETGPYRDGGVAPVRYVCLVCFKTYAFGPSECPTCRLERLPIDRREVYDAVLDEALRRTDQRSEPMTGWKRVLFTAAMFVPIVGGLLALDQRETSRSMGRGKFANKLRANLPSYTGDQLVDFLKMKPK